MNKLNGSLLHACFEQGPFDQKDLIRACQAFPRLARFWLTSENKALGMHIRHRSWSKAGCVYSTQSSFAFETEVLSVQHGISWFFSSSKTQRAMGLGIELVDRGSLLSRFQIDCSRCPQDILFEDLEKALQWMLKYAPQSSLFFYVHEDQGIHRITSSLGQFLSKPSFPRTLKPQSLINVFRIYKRTAVDHCSLFDALAKSCFENHLALNNKS